MRRLIKNLLPACRHEFSWPRRNDSGDTYQVCILCGVKYSYDWATMRRIAPLPGGEEDEVAPKTHRKCGTKQAWVPRERRLRHQVPLRWRMLGSQEWVDGVSKNISRSGLLFHCSVQLEVGAQLELMLELPHELTGEDDAHALCEGVVVRVEHVSPARANKQSAYAVACSIAQYRMLPPQA
jgi:PilZ domain-containing protein